MQPVRIALAIDESRDEAALLGLLQDPAFVADERPCQVVTLCASARELHALVAARAVDLVIVASGFNAMGVTALRALAGDRPRLLVVDPDPDQARWEGAPVTLVEPDPSSARLAEAISAALRGYVASPRRQRPFAPFAPPASPATAVTSAGGDVVAVASAYTGGEGRTLVATALAVALARLGRTVLVDADVRAAAAGFCFPVSPTRNICLVAQDAPESRAQWDAILERHLQAMGAPADAGWILCGVPKPALRSWLTASPVFYERLVGVLKERYRHVILDTAGGGWSADDDPIDRASLHLADRILLVLRPDERGVELARRALRQFPRRDRVALVLNQAGLDGQEDPAEIEVALGVGIAASVPFDPRGVGRARARHRPVVCQPGARAAAPLLALAGRLAGGGPVEVPTDPLPGVPLPWWRRLAMTAVGGTHP